MIAGVIGSSVDFKNNRMAFWIDKGREPIYIERKYVDKTWRQTEFYPADESNLPDVWSFLKETTFTHGYITFTSGGVHAFAVLFDPKKRVAVRVDYVNQYGAPSFEKIEEENNRSFDVHATVQKRMIGMQVVNSVLCAFGAVHPVTSVIGFGVISMAQIGSGIFVSDKIKPTAGRFIVETVEYDKYRTEQAKETKTTVSWAELISDAQFLMFQYLGTLKGCREFCTGGDDGENCMTAILTLSAKLDLELEIVNHRDHWKEKVIQIFRKTEIMEAVKKDLEERKRLIELRAARKKNRKQQQDETQKNE